MASQVLVSGSGGNIGRQIKDIAQNEIQYLNNRFDLLDRLGPAKFIDFATETGCKSVLHLAWSANTSLEYLNEKTQNKWVDRTIEIVERALSSGIKTYCLGTGQELEQQIENPYVNAKRVLHSKLSDKGLRNEIIWIRPFYIFSHEIQIPRIVRDFRTDPNNFKMNSPFVSHDYIDIRDVASGVHFTIKHNLLGNVEIGTGKLTKNLDLLKIVCGYDIAHDLVETQVKGVAANISKLLEIGWNPDISEKVLKSDEN